jgi:hypothetical protein
VQSDIRASGARAPRVRLTAPEARPKTWRTNSRLTGRASRAPPPAAIRRHNRTLELARFFHCSHCSSHCFFIASHCCCGRGVSTIFARPYIADGVDYPLQIDCIFIRHALAARTDGQGGRSSRSFSVSSCSFSCSSCSCFGGFSSVRPRPCIRIGVEFSPVIACILFWPCCGSNRPTGALRRQVSLRRRSIAPAVARNETKGWFGAASKTNLENRAVSTKARRGVP